MSIARWCDDAITMVRWSDNDDSIEHRFIAIVTSYHRHRVIAPSSSHCRNIVSSSSSSHHRVIAPPTRWCDSELRDPIRIPYLHSSTIDKNQSTEMLLETLQIFLLTVDLWIKRRCYYKCWFIDERKSICLMTKLLIFKVTACQIQCFILLRCES